MTTLVNRVKQLAKNGMDKAKIRATLVLEDHKQKDIEKALKDAKIVSARSDFSTRFYDLLIKSAMTEEQLRAMVKKESKNTQKHFSHFNRIRITVNAAVEKRAK